MIYNTIMILISIGLFAQAGVDSAIHFVRLQSNKTNPLYGYQVGPGTEKLDKPVLRPFSTDGCSQSPNSYSGKEIVECCVKHDVAYWLGGTQIEKDQADGAFKACISEKVGAAVAEVYYRGVRVGGGARAINTFRWGYGWDVVRDYTPISEDDRKQAQQLMEQPTDDSYAINWELLTLDMLGVNRSYDDELVYYYLQNNLKRNDIVTFGQKLHYSDRSFFYRIRLKSCGESVVDFKIDHFKAWKKFVHRNVSIHNLPWSKLEKYILEVRDPDSCLNQP